MRYIKKTQAGSKKSFSYDAYIFEYKIGVLSLEHVVDTIYLKDYVNCIANGTNGKVRSVNSPLRNLYTKVKTKLLRQPKIENIIVVMLADRISKQADQYVEKINKANKYIYRASTGDQIPVKIVLRTYKEYIVSLNKNYTIQWDQLKNINSQLKQMSEILPANQFPKWDQEGKLIGYWKDQELLGF